MFVFPKFRENLNSIKIRLVVSSFMIMSSSCIPLMGQTQKWPKGKEFRENYELSQIGENLYVHGRGSVFRSSDGGSTWREVFNLYVGIAAPKTIRSEFWREDDTLFYEVQDPDSGVKSVASTDGVRWASVHLGFKKYIPSSLYPFRSACLIAGSNEPLVISQTLEIDSLTHLLIGSILDDSTEHWYTTCYKQIGASTFWAPVQDIPIIEDSVESFFLWYYGRYLFTDLQYLPDEGVVLAYLEGAGLFCSCDAGMTWKRTVEIAPESEIVGFSEWKRYVVVVLTNGSVIRIGKEKLCLEGGGEVEEKVPNSPPSKLFH